MGQFDDGDSIVPSKPSGGATSSPVPSTGDKHAPLTAAAGRRRAALLDDTQMDITQLNKNMNRRGSETKALAAATGGGRQPPHGAALKRPQPFVWARLAFQEQPGADTAVVRASQRKSVGVRGADQGPDPRWRTSRGGYGRGRGTRRVVELMVVIDAVLCRFPS